MVREVRFLWSDPNPPNLRVDAAAEEDDADWDESPLDPPPKRRRRTALSPRPADTDAPRDPAPATRQATTRPRRSPGSPPNE